MNLKRLFRGLVPPLLRDAWLSCRHAGRPGYIWKGVYAHYRDVPTAGPGFAGEVWARAARESVVRLLAARQPGGAIPLEVANENALLPFLAASLRREGGTVRILDFGGGLGESYLQLTSSAVGCPAVDYHIVETPVICALGTELVGAESGLHFHDHLPADLRDVDIVYINSALQYVKDYASLLASLCAYQPAYILLVRLAAGDIPTYATAQRNVRGSTIAYWFLRVGEVIDLMGREGYRLVWKGAVERQYNQDNFPRQYRLGRYCSLLFARGGERG